MLALLVFAGMACLVGNTATFYLFGLGFVPMLFAGAAMTALPLALGHLAYERIVAAHRWLQTGVRGSAYLSTKRVLTRIKYFEPPSVRVPR